MNLEQLLALHRPAMERYVRCRLPSKADAEDVIQDVLITALNKAGQLRQEEAFRAWLLGVARNKCNDYFRRKARQAEVSIDLVSEEELHAGCFRHPEAGAVQDALDSLGPRDREILDLFYWEELSQADIAQQLRLPLGTVKSRLHTARENFRRCYPRTETIQGGLSMMKKLPAQIPAYTIEPLVEPPFPVVWEEMMGWFLVPRLGEKLSWGMYDQPSGKLSNVYDMEVTGQAQVHGIDGVELIAREAPYSGKQELIQRTFVAQLTDTHCRILACMRTENGVRRYITFLDGDAFLPNWGFGENNCGNETHLSPKGDIRRTGDVVDTIDKEFLLDIVGRYAVTIGGKRYDTVCVMDVETYNAGVVSEQFLDAQGRTILWRRYNRNDWAFKRYRQLWTDMLPDNARLTVNGATYVHWYDCVTDYIL